VLNVLSGALSSVGVAFQYYNAELNALLLDLRSVSICMKCRNIDLDVATRVCVEGQDYACVQSVLLAYPSFIRSYFERSQPHDLLRYTTSARETKLKKRLQ